jgi:hypothetical protein
MNQLKSSDLFELDRVLEDIAKTYAAPAATVWFKVTNNRGSVKSSVINHLFVIVNKL